MRMLIPFLSIALLGPAHVTDGQEERKVVLMLSDFRPDSRATIDREAIIRATLSQVFPGGLDYYPEFIDATTFQGPQYAAALREFLRHKYESRHFDAIIAVGQSALDFAQANAVAFFNGAPIIASTVDKEAIQQTAGGPVVTGVTRTLDPKATIDFILRLQPQTTRLAVIAGGRVFIPLEELARLALRSFEQRLTVDYWFDLPMDDVLARVRTLPPRSAILYLGITEDGASRRFLPTDALTMIREATKAPMYGMFANYVDFGLVGGMVIDTNIMAKEVADLTVEQLRLGASRAAPARETRSTIPIVNWRELRRWGISEARVPADAVILDREPGAFERYRWYIVGTLSLIFFQATLIVALLAQRTRRRHAESVLRANESVLRSSYEHIQDLAGRLIAAQEVERKRIARDLHDDLSQKLALLSLDIDQLSDSAGASSGNVAVRVHAISKRTREISRQVHDLSHELHPSMLETVGLVAATRAWCREISSQYDLDIRFEHAGVPPDVPAPVALCLFRIVQEAVHNVVKHSGAKKASVSISQDAWGLRLQVADVGRGFSLRNTERAGLGLVSMRERVNHLGGEIAILTAAGQGTRIDVCIPIKASSIGGRVKSQQPPQDRSESLAPHGNVPPPESPPLNSRLAFLKRARF
jgi:signal transduction histidine kinase